MTPPLRIIFMGSAQLSCPSLQALKDDPQCELLAVVTQPDRPKGRDLKLQPTPVKELALNLQLSVLQPEKARDAEFVAQVRALQPDLIAVTAYGQILPKPLLEVPRFGCVNVHTSLLPKYRGAGPIQWALLNDESETGVTIMQMDEGLDTGAILAQARTVISGEDNAQTLYNRLGTLGANLLRETIHDYVSGRIQGTPQPAESATYAHKIKKQDGLIDWTLPARAIWCRVRGLTPWPCAFTYLPAHPKPQLLKIWAADITHGTGAPGEVLQADKMGIVVAAGDGRALRILQLQREGGRRLPAQDFLAGHVLARGTRIG